MDDEDISRLRHDLRTPLTVVAGFAELLADAPSLTDEQRREYARRIVNAAEDIRRQLAATERG